MDLPDLTRGLCRQSDPEAWFPERGGNAPLARAVCASCPVREPCLEFGVEHPELVGIWGGAGQGARIKLARGRRRARV